MSILLRKKNIIGEVAMKIIGLESEEEKKCMDDIVATISSLQDHGFNEEVDSVRKVLDILLRMSSKLYAIQTQFPAGVVSRQRFGKTSVRWFDELEDGAQVFSMPTHPDYCEVSSPWEAVLGFGAWLTCLEKVLRLDPIKILQLWRSWFKDFVKKMITKSHAMVGIK